MAKFQEYRERKEKEYQESYDRRITLRYLQYVFSEGREAPIRWGGAVFRIRIRIDFGRLGPGGQKWTVKIENREEIYIFEVLDFLFWKLKAK